MSVYLKVVPAVMLEPDILLDLGINITSLVRKSLILDLRMEEICNSIDREGRTLDKIISRNAGNPLTGEIDEAAIACEKSCSQLKAAVQLHYLQPPGMYPDEVQLLHGIFEKPAKISSKNAYSLSSERISDIIGHLESIAAQEALSTLHLDGFYDDLKSKFEVFESMLAATPAPEVPEQLPTLRSSIALYGMLLDTLIANVRFENYRQLHRVQSILSQIETVISGAVDASVKKQHERTIQPAIAV